MSLSYGRQHQHSASQEGEGLKINQDQVSQSAMSEQSLALLLEKERECPRYPRFHGI